MKKHKKIIVVKNSFICLMFITLVIRQASCKKGNAFNTSMCVRQVKKLAILANRNILCYTCPVIQRYLHYPYVCFIEQKCDIHFREEEEKLTNGNITVSSD